jgi:hypothetical protein
VERSVVPSAEQEQDVQRTKRVLQGAGEIEEHEQVHRDVQGILVHEVGGEQSPVLPEVEEQWAGFRAIEEQRVLDVRSWPELDGRIPEEVQDDEGGGNLRKAAEPKGRREVQPAGRVALLENLQ